MKKPLIGVVPLMDAGRESYWMLPGYFHGLEKAGAIPIMLPLTAAPQAISQLADGLDGFLLTGGQDVDPARYQDTPLPLCGELCPDRDRMETALLQAVLSRDKPVLGICRGIQFLNVFLGGTLYQDLPAQRPSNVEHHQAAPYDQPIHEVIIEESTPLFQLLGKNRIAVNSCHHQGIKALAPELHPMACAEDGLTEAVWMPSKRFVWAVQWHPEFSYLVSEESQEIFRAFAGACAAINKKGAFTMDAMENLLTRRSVRAYKPDMVPEDVLERIIRAGTYAATGMGRQSPIIIAVTNKELRDKLSKQNAAIMGAESDPFYGAPVVLIVLADKNMPTHVYDGSLVMGNLMLAAHAEGVASCWIHRAKEEFESDEGKALLKSLGITGDYEGVGHCILGYADCEEPQPKPRKEDYVYYIR